MLFGQIIREAFGALWANKARALLTMLGVIIGVGAVIAMMAIGQGAKRAVQERIASMGVGRLMVFGGTRATRGMGRRVNITTDDAQALARHMREDAAVVPEVVQQYQVKYRNRNAEVQIDGTVPHSFSMWQMKLAAGRFFNDAELQGRRLVAVLSDGAMEMLGGKPSMVGEYIRIRGIPLQVIGLLKRKGIEDWHPSPDEMIFIPITTMQFRLVGTGFVMLSVQAASPDRMIPTAEEIERILRRSHRLRPDQPNDFRIHDMRAITEAYAETAKTFSLLLASIAAISLIVGGIGIMNIMLVSVTERTREIGIRKAVGARRAIILLQFVLEAIVLCILGGALGIGAGVGAATIMANKFGWVTVVMPQSVLMALGVSIAVGLFFGIYPAIRASRLDPVEALRYE